MKILITNHWLKKLGGSETFTYTLAGELKRQGHEVDLFTHVPGLVSERIKKDFSIKARLQNSYDLILANHKTTVESVHHLGKTIQTCHGTIPKLEQPSPKAHRHVAISLEVRSHLIDRGFTGYLIYNGIDCNRFKPKQPLNPRLKTVLSLCHSDEANQTIAEACKILGVKLLTINKYKQQIWNMQEYINQADLVISLGRGVYEAMACGRPVVVFDKRPYQPSYADGYMSPGVVNGFITNNCSGRFLKLNMDAYQLAAALRQYDPEHGEAMRDFATRELNIAHQVPKYLRL